MTEERLTHDSDLGMWSCIIKKISFLEVGYWLQLLHFPFCVLSQKDLLICTSPQCFFRRFLNSSDEINSNDIVSSSARKNSSASCCVPAFKYIFPALSATYLLMESADTAPLDSVLKSLESAFETL